MGKPQLEKSEGTNVHVSANTKCNSKQTIEKSNEHPEWLPDGWIVDSRTRKSGANMGYGYKCYIDPSGYKFYSKPEVLRYIETIKSNSCTSRKEERCKTLHSPNNNVVEKSTVEDLPPGWITEAKIRKGGNNNRKDLFYIDPVSRYVFRSKKDALRYLESGDISTCVLKPIKRQIQDEDKLTLSFAGNKQKLKQSATKRQLFVGKETSDEGPIESPDVSLKKGQDVTVSSGVMVAPVPTGEPVVKMQFLENTASHPPEMKKTSDPDDVQEENNAVDVMENASKKRHNNCRLSKNKEFNVAHRFSRRLAGVEPDQLTNLTNEQTQKVPKGNLRKSRTVLDADLANKSFQQHNGVPEIEHSHKMQGKVQLNKSSILSEGHAGFKEQPHQVETDKIEDSRPEQNQYSLPRDSGLLSLKVATKTVRAELPSLDNPCSSHGLVTEARVLENKLHANGIGKSGLKEVHLNSNKSSNKKEIPCRASKRLAGFEPELMCNSISYERAPEYKNKKTKGEVNANLQQSEGQQAMKLVDHASINGDSSDKSIKPKIPPTTNNQLKKPEEEVDDEKSEPQQSLAFHYSWSDPCLEFAIQTLTGALPVEGSVGNVPTRVPETDPKNKLFENVTGSSSDRKQHINSKKSKKKKELEMPRRLSKRLAGHEPEVLPTERALEYETRKSCKDKPTATAVLTNGASGHLHAGEESKIIDHASDRLKTILCGESPNKSEKSYDAQTIANEQLQSLEAENIDDRSEPQLPLTFGDSWSDPCLEFAFKTLTGALPVDATADIFPVMTPDVNYPPKKELLESVKQKNINEGAHDNSNQSQTQKELNMVYQPSIQPLDQPELSTRPISCENDLKFAPGESYSGEGNITRNLGGRESIHMEAGNVTQIDINAMILEEPLKEKQVLEGESAAQQLQPETETINRDNSEREFCLSFMDSWSDPCLEFAFKTLTGAIPVEENIAIQGCFQEPANRHDQSDGSPKLPEFGSSSISQSNILFQNDTGEKSKPGQQSSTSSSFLPQENPSLHGFTRVDPQKHYSQYGNNFQRR